MTKFQNNPPWDKAEIILALNLYLNHKPGTKHGSTAEMQELSEQLRRISRHDSIADPETFRNISSVKTKLANLQYLDPDEETKGLRGASKLDKEIWDKYHNRPELVKELAESILDELLEDLASNNGPETDEEELEYPEGRYLYRMHRQRERNSRLIVAAKTNAQKEGKLSCSVCGFDFEKVYGELGHGFIECHHVKPLNEYRKGDVTHIEDLVLVCSNCHRMLHRHKPILTPDELRNMLVNNSDILGGTEGSD